MIVGPEFDGDDYEELQLQQHDAYHQAIRMMMDVAVSRLRAAQEIVGQETELGQAVKDSPTFDHRDIQRIHDLLAAIWRAEQGLLHPPLPLAGMHVEKFVTEWLDWLKRRMTEMDGWHVSLLLKAVLLRGDAQDDAEAILLDDLRSRLRRLVSQRAAAGR